MKQTIDLSGQWTLRTGNNKINIKTRVPTMVHPALEKAGLIPNPFYRDNEKNLQWISCEDWIFERRFNCPAGFYKYQEIKLNCTGLDTFAEITVNNQKVGHSDNMFRPWQFSVKNFLQPGQNKISVKFKSVLPYMQQQEQKRHLKSVKNCLYEPDGRSWVRKMQCNFGWDWGPVLITAGIFDRIFLETCHSVKIDDLYTEQQHSRNRCKLTVHTRIKNSCSRAYALKTELLDPAGKNIYSHTSYTHNLKNKLDINIKNPQLWWVNGLGGQPLYTLINKLYDDDNLMVDFRKYEVGLRLLKLVRQKDRWGESFYFTCNNVPFFAKGANWIPAETFITEAGKEKYSYLLQAARNAHMNMIRVWGGGFYEKDIFYTLCDRLGLAVWQDFMFACSAYPADDQCFLSNVRAEAEYQIKRLRHHASLALWCGNNELEMFIVKFKHRSKWPLMPAAYYKKLFDKLLKKSVQKYSPHIPYWPGSPHSPHGNRDCDNDPRWGDCHFWDVWHANQPFNFYRTSLHRFVSEFGFQSFPEPASIKKYTKKNERNLTHPVMETHQRNKKGNARIVRYLLDWFRLPAAPQNFFPLSQILQAEAMKTAVEHWRLNMPRCMGALYWQLNDCWPVTSWSSLDYYGRWKAAHYYAVRFFAPVLVSAVAEQSSKTVTVYIINDTIQRSAFRLNCTFYNLNGAKLMHSEKNVKIPPLRSTKVKTLNYKNLCTNNYVFLYLALYRETKLISQNSYMFNKPKAIDFPDPQINIKQKKIAAGKYRCSLTCKKPAFWIHGAAEDNTVLSDNFFHLFPGNSKNITITCPPGSKPGTKLRNLTDLY